MDVSVKQSVLRAQIEDSPIDGLLTELDLYCQV